MTHGTCIRIFMPNIPFFNNPIFLFTFSESSLTSCTKYRSHPCIDPESWRNFVAILQYLLPSVKTHPCLTAGRRTRFYWNLWGRTIVCSCYCWLCLKAKFCCIRWGILRWRVSLRPPHTWVNALKCRTRSCKPSWVVYCQSTGVITCKMGASSD